MKWYLMVPNSIRWYLMVFHSTQWYLTLIISQMPLHYFLGSVYLKVFTLLAAAAQGNQQNGRN